MFKITRGSTFKTYFLLATIMTHLFFNRNSWWNMMCCCTNCTCPIRWGHGNFQSTYTWVGTQCRRPMQRVMGTHQIIPKCVWTLRELCDQDTFKILQSYIKNTPEKSRRFNFTPLQQTLTAPYGAASCTFHQWRTMRDTTWASVLAHLRCQQHVTWRTYGLSWSCINPRWVH